MEGKRKLLFLRKQKLLTRSQNEIDLQQLKFFNLRYSSAKENLGFSIFSPSGLNRLIDEHFVRTGFINVKVK